MNLRDLQYLVTVAELRHFGKAAERCHVSQPTLSMQIRKLEDYLGVEIFERTGRRVMVTTAGEQIVERAQVLLRDYEELQLTASTGWAPSPRSPLICCPASSRRSTPLIRTCACCWSRRKPSCCSAGCAAGSLISRCSHCP